MKQLEFAGMVLKNEPRFTFDQVFDVVWDDSELVAVSKEIYHHDYEDDYKFDYQYAIQITNMDVYDDVENNVIMDLYLVITMDSVCDTVKEKLLDSAGVDEDEFGVVDMIESGYAIRISGESWSNHEIDDLFQDSKVQQKCLAIANMLTCIDTLKSFALDKYVNRIGTTGWDMLDSAINGSDWVKETMKRWEEEK